MVVTGRLRPKKIIASFLFFASFIIFISKTAIQNRTVPEDVSLPTVPPFPLSSYSVIHLPGYFQRTASPCIPPHPTLLAIVHSSPSHILHRRAIRETWGSSSSQRNITIRTVFVVGRSQVPKIEQRVQLEAKEHGDVIQLEMLDEYNNLTLKHLAGLHWGLQNCPAASFILKADDDAFVDVGRAMKILSSAFGVDDTTDLIACRVVPDGTAPRRSGKWKVSKEEYPPSEYPEYCSGLAYFSRPATLARLLTAAMSGKVPYLWVDDVFVTGIAAQHAAIKRLDLGVWFARTEQQVIKWLSGDSAKHFMPWIVAEMTPRHWPSDALALWKKVKEAGKEKKKGNIVSSVT